MRDKLEIEKATAEATAKGLIGALPFVGTALNELLFDARGRMKQERINKFVQAFHAYLAGLQEGDLHVDQIEKEDFGDFFEALLVRVARNHSEQKREAFLRLLSNQLRRPSDIDYALLFVDIISELHEKQIPILDRFYLSQPECTMHLRIQTKLFRLRQEYSEMTTFKNRMENDIYAEGMLDIGTGTGKINQKIKETHDQIISSETEVQRYDASHLPVTYGLTTEEFFTLTQDLCNKGLLTDFSSRYSYNPLSVLEISELGKRLMASLTLTEVHSTSPESSGSDQTV